ncbi:MAG: hypothetical protein ACI4RN_00120 [Oscillospiraceae bacterium]
MEDIQLKIIYKDGNEDSIKPINFRFVRERYTPFTQLSGNAVFNGDILEIKTIELYWEDNLLHCGMPDNVTKRFSDGRFILSFLSRGYTMLLGQNEPKPGIRNNISLGSLISENTQIPHVSWQGVSDVANYIYVKEKSTIWDAVCAYAYKVFENYPYIKNANSVYVKDADVQHFSYGTEKILSMGESVNTSSILSKVYMKDVGDDESTYSFSKSNTLTDGMDIVRVKYYPLDKQWLSDCEKGMSAKLGYSSRNIKSKFIVYKGFKGENLCDTASYCTADNSFLLSEKISKVELSGSRKGLITKITV